jgi:four helix bundle protein
MKILSYRDLKVWQLAMDFVVAVYTVTRGFPATEQYGLTSQIQRAAVSVPANIAEGQGRAHLNEYLHHLSFARGSLMEIETHLLIAERLGYLGPRDSKQLLSAASDIGRMLNALSRSLKAKRPPAP